MPPCWLALRRPLGYVLLMDEPIEMPIDGVLDLHTFNPREIKDLVPDYLAACQERGITQVRIIHGKGIGNLRRTVHSILSKHPEVISFTLDHPQYGGWGATIVSLRKLGPDGSVTAQRAPKQ
jgi:DNA-nicking Smr family endonuclease